MSSNTQALKLALSVIGGSGPEKLNALVRIREVIIADETLQGTDQRNSHPAFKAVLESLSEVQEPNLNDMQVNDDGMNAGVMSASNLVGVLASLGRQLETLAAKKATQDEIVSDADIKCIVSQCRHLAGV